MKILYVTTVATTMDFFPEHIKMLQAQGHTVELASNMEPPVSPKVAALGCPVHHIPFSRSPLSPDNLRAYGELKQLVEAGHYDLVHTHTPNASVLVRLACRKLRKQGLRVFYTAHGFHFFRGAPRKNWLLFYPAEKLCSYFTDVLITITLEDYALAQNKFHAGKTFYIPGVGLDTSYLRCLNTDPDAKRRELGLADTDTVLLSVGELNENKNHASVIRALGALKNPHVHYLIAGMGDQHDALLTLAGELGISAQLHLLGYRGDVPELYRAADFYVHPSFREGLSVSTMEAMASGLPVACGRIRGNVDLIDPQGGVLFDPRAQDQVESALRRLLAASPEARAAMGKHNVQKVQGFSTGCVLEKLDDIYRLNH